MAKLVDLGKDLGTRIDFEDDFDLVIRQKGYKALWSRGVFCPCRLNTQTEQPDPSCTVCGGDGWFYVLPAETPRPLRYDQESPTFKDVDDARATHVVVTSITKDPQIFERFGEWLFGAAMVTAYSFHPIQFRDRLVLVDETMSWQQVIELPASKVIPVGRGDPRTNLRYPAVSLLHAYEVSGTPATAVDRAEAATVNDDGSITFAGSTPAVGTRLALVYRYNPVLILVDHIHGVRGSPKRSKTTSKLGAQLPMPLQSAAKLDFLLSPGTANGAGATL